MTTATKARRTKTAKPVENLSQMTADFVNAFMQATLAPIEEPTTADRLKAVAFMRGLLIGASHNYLSHVGKAPMSNSNLADIAGELRMLSDVWGGELDDSLFTEVEGDRYAALTNALEADE